MLGGQNTQCRSGRHYFYYRGRWRPRGGSGQGTNTPWLLHTPLATPGTNFPGPPAARCELRPDHEKNRFGIDHQGRWRSALCLCCGGTTVLWWYIMWAMPGILGGKIRARWNSGLPGGLLVSLGTCRERGVRIGSWQMSELAGKEGRSGPQACGSLGSLAPLIWRLPFQLSCCRHTSWRGA